MRTISVSEAGTIFDCEAKHAFAYTGHLTAGDALKRKVAAVTLRRGRAWGRAVAEWHATGDRDQAVHALAVALEEDADEQRQAGVYVHGEHLELLDHLVVLLDHYVGDVDRIPLVDRELELRTRLPSRTGRRLSNRYEFHGYVDGLTRDYEVPGLWIVEFKIRDRLSTFEQIAWSRQVRWYAWAAERCLGEPVAGVIVDERLNEIPKPARWVKAKRKGEGIDGMTASHAADQVTTVDSYIDVCRNAGVDPHPETVDAIAARRWQTRHPVLLRRAEIDRGARELVSAAQLIADMDRGDRYPVANPSQFRCPGCAFRDICRDPTDSELIDLDFNRTVPKRHRSQETEVSATQTLEQVAA